MNEEVKEPTVEEAAVVDETTEEEELSPWYYFFSQGCGWCKKSTPVVNELNDSGHDILILDLAEPDNQALANELKGEYKVQCGTPWFINADTGKQICGFRDKDVLEKWLDGEDIPAPPKATGPPPKLPFQGATGKEETAWKKEYNQWLEDNSHMPDAFQKQTKSASELIDGPRPKSDPPKPPMPMGPEGANVTNEVIDKWGEDMKLWQKENDHLPNMQPVDRIIQSVKQRRDQMKNQQSGAPSGNMNNPQIKTLTTKVQSLEKKMDKLMNHLGIR